MNDQAPPTAAAAERMAGRVRGTSGGGAVPRESVWCWCIRRLGTLAGTALYAEEGLASCLLLGGPPAAAAGNSCWGNAMAARAAKTRNRRDRTTTIVRLRFATRPSPKDPTRRVKFPRRRCPEC